MNGKKSPIEVPYYKFFNLNRIRTALNIDKDLLYNNFAEKYDSLGATKEHIFSLMKPKVQLFFEKLGYIVAFTKLKRDN